MNDSIVITVYFVIGGFAAWRCNLVYILTSIRSRHKAKTHTLYSLSEAKTDEKHTIVMAFIAVLLWPIVITVMYLLVFPTVYVINVHRKIKGKPPIEYV